MEESVEASYCNTSDPATGITAMPEIADREGERLAGGSRKATAVAGRFCAGSALDD